MSINLLPWREIKRDKQKQKLLYRFIIYFIILFFLSLMVRLFFYIDIKKTYDPLHKNELLLKKLIYFHAQQKSTKQLNTDVQIILFHIANIIPRSIILDQLAINAKTILLEGKGDQLADIHRYVNALQTKKSGAVQLTNIQTDEKKNSSMRFTIEISRQGQKHEK